MNIIVAIRIKIDTDNENQYKIVRNALKTIKKNATIQDLEQVFGTNVYKII